MLFRSVTLIVPAVEDSLLVRFASQAYRGDLAAAGVRVMEFRGGLLHTKTVVVDNELSLIGSLNLDPRSFFINFEITLAIFDTAFAEQLGRPRAGDVRAEQQTDPAPAADAPEWLDSLDSVIDGAGRARARYLIARLMERATAGRAARRGR